MGNGRGLKLIALLALGCVAAVALAGCGGDGERSSGGSADVPNEVAGTVTVWDFEYESFPGFKKAMDQLDAEFEAKYPKVTVDRVAEPYESYEAAYRAAFTAHQGPDVMSMQPGESGVLSFAKGLEVLNDRIPPELEENMTQWQTVTPGLRREGDHYGIPVGLQGWVFYYNKELFQKAGLPREFEPKTWDEVREAGEKLKRAGIQPFTSGNKEGLENSFWFSVGFQSANSEEQISELAEGDLPYTDKAVVDGLEPLIEMYEAELFPSDWFSTPWIPNGYASFAEEKGAMILGFWSRPGNWEEYDQALGESNVGMFFPPGNNPVGAFGGYAYSIPTFADNKDAAWALLEFYGGKHANEVIFEVAGNLPLRRDVELPPDAPEQAVELVEAAQRPDAVVAPFAAMESNIAFTTLPQEINQALQGRTSLDAALGSVQETAEKAR